MLLEIKKMLLRIHTEIRCCRNELRKILENCQEFLICGEAVRRKEFYVNPQTCLKNSAKELIPDSGDRKLFSEFIDGFGVSDTESQLNHITLYTEIFEEHLENAREENRKKRKLFVFLGLFAGITLSLILL